MKAAHGREPKGSKPRWRRMQTFYRWGFSGWLALVVAISIGAYTGLLPTSIPSFEGADKIGHFFLIGGLGFFADGATRRRGPIGSSLGFPLASAAVLVVAGIEEYLQRLSPRRSSSFGDFAADVAGVAVLTFASRWLERRWAGQADAGQAATS